MLETFLVLFAGGIMFAAAIPRQRDVTLHWVRLGGILALTFAGMGSFWFFRHANAGRAPIILTSVSIASICAQLAFVQISARNAQRAFSLLAFVCCEFCGIYFLDLQLAQANYFFVGVPLSCIGIAAACGIALMDMLLGHAYLTASRMTMKPFLLLNLSLAITLGFRAVCNVAAIVIERSHPIEMFWGANGLLIMTRWLVGLLVPAIFVYMAHDCIKRRATQSATGILYVAGVLVFIGEIIALQLVRDTGLPF